MISVEEVKVDGLKAVGLRVELPESPPLILVIAKRGFLMCGYMSRETAGKLRLRDTTVFLILIATAFGLIRLRASRLAKAPLMISVATTGFAGMAFDMVLILAFQSLYGYVYHRLGLLITAFMAGLTTGGVIMAWMMPRIRRDIRLLAGIELSIALYSILVPATLTLLHLDILRALASHMVQATLFTFSSISGFLVGLEFPLANKIYLKGERGLGHVAGTLYASDLLGSWAGALAVSAVLIPVLGIVRTCLLISVMKGISLALLLSPPRFNCRSQI